MCIVCMSKFFLIESAREGGNTAIEVRAWGGAIVEVRAWVSMSSKYKYVNGKIVSG